MKLVIILFIMERVMDVTLDFSKYIFAESCPNLQINLFLIWLHCDLHYWRLHYMAFNVFFFLNYANIYCYITNFIRVASVITSKI